MSEKVTFSPADALQVTSYNTYLKGKEYFYENRVHILKKDSKKIRAKVRGTIEYEIFLEKDEQGEPVYKCSCPFDKEGACKHVVAVIFKLSNLKVGGKSPVRNTKKDLDIISKLTLKQAKEFISKLYKEDPDIIDKLKINLLGNTESFLTEKDYFNNYKAELKKIDPVQLMEVWYLNNQEYEHDDGYWGSDFEYGDSENELSGWTDKVLEYGGRYTDNQNYKEALKIFVAAIRALSKQRDLLKVEYPDLTDYFDPEIGRMVDSFVDFVKKNKNFFNKDLIIKALIRLISLDSLKSWCGKLIILLAEIYKDSKNWDLLKDLVEKYLKNYPPVALVLLDYYFSVKDKKNLKILAEKTLILNKKYDSSSFEQYYDQSELEVKIRRQLLEVYSTNTEYPDALNNAENLFMVSRNLKDYEVLRGIYKSETEKKNFWQNMERKFASGRDIKLIFRVYKFEKEKSRILKLIKKYPEANCFPSMVDDIKSVFPEDCYTAYKNKIDKLLIYTDTDIYVDVALHLKHMAGIGFNDRFAKYLASIRSEYKRRRCLMEELDKKGL